MANIKKVVKGVKKLTNKQKTYQMRGAIAKLEREVEAKGGKPSPQRIADLKAKTMKTIKKNKKKPYKGSAQY